MNGEIKFRAWDKENKEMLPWEWFIAWDSEPITCEPNFFDSTLIFEQYIGLKDKNGVGIYEGDIVRILIHREYPGSPGTKDKYRNEIVKNGCRCGLNTNGMISIQEKEYEEYGPQIEVIGNIHENPELLKD